MHHHDHRKHGQVKGPIHVAIVTISDTRDETTDKNGPYLKAELQKAEYELASYIIVKDDPEAVRDKVKELAAGDAQVILLNGGTGISARDNTFDTLSALIEKPLPGFGELFRMLSFDQVGSVAMLSRATAGVYKKTLLFSTPGSSKAVELAWEKLIAPQLGHLVWELTR
jgi:molybdopterin adenylyltransferase